MPRAWLSNDKTLRTKLRDEGVELCIRYRQGLKAGDLGAIVDLHQPDGLDVEFVTAGGRTQAVVTLRASDVRKVGPRDMVAVRPVQPAA
jgi:hypothetical protein